MIAMHNRPLELLIKDFERMMELQINVLKHCAKKTHHSLDEFGLRMHEEPYYFPLQVIVDSEGETQEYEVFELTGKGIENEIDSLASDINTSIWDHPEYLSTFKEKFKIECDKMGVKVM